MMTDVQNRYDDVPHGVDVGPSLPREGTPPPLPRVTGLTKAFAETVVVDGVDFTVQPGQIVALVGEHGVGKSTLKNMLCGLLPPDGGTIELDGQPLSACGSEGRFRGAYLGIAAVHQEFSLFGPLSVAENVCMSNLPGRSTVVNWRQMHEVARIYLDSIGARMRLDLPVELLSTGEQQLVEIAKALRQASRLLAGRNGALRSALPRAPGVTRTSDTTRDITRPAKLTTNYLSKG